MKEFENFKAHVYNHLGVGHQNAKGRRQLCRDLKCGDRVLRKAIEELRRDYPILTRDDGKGYYLPETTEEGREDARRWVARQNRRIVSIRAATAGAKKFSKPRKDMPGQLSMFGAGRYL